MTTFYRPGVGWWPKTPTSKSLPPTGGSEEWTGELILDWTTGLCVPRSVAEDYITTKRFDRWPGLRVKPVKSSATHKYHYGGPYNGCKLRKTFKRKGRADVEYLPDIYVLPPWHGRYEYLLTLDMYSWKD